MRAAIRITILIALLSATATGGRAQTSAKPASGEIKKAQAAAASTSSSVQ